MSGNLFGVDFSPEEITLDNTGKVIINNPNLAEAVKSATATVTARRRPRPPGGGSTININCPCPI